MDNNSFFRSALSDFAFDAAYGDSIRHLHNSGFTPQRIKDYLIGLAAVAILLMFFNLLNAKIKTLKAARDQAKKMKDMMEGQHNYPTI